MKKFQHKVGMWVLKCFGEKIALDKLKRVFRFTEEALELGQSLGLTKQQALELVDYVYGREIGHPEQEIGGVSVTLGALCFAHKIDWELAADTELSRVHQKIDKIRAKHFSKPENILSPLPGTI